MPIWLELLVLALIAYGVGWAIGWAIWAQPTGELGGKE